MTTDQTRGKSDQETIRRLSRASQDLATALSDATRPAGTSETAIADVAATSEEAEPEVQVEDTRRSGVRRAARALAWPARRLLDARFQGLAQQLDQKQIDLFDRLEVLRQEELLHNQAERAALTRILTMLEQVESGTTDETPGFAPQPFERPPNTSVEAERLSYSSDAPSQTKRSSKRLRPVHTPGAREAMTFVERSDFLWYQRFELAGDVWTPGTRDVAQALRSCGAPLDMSGLAVIDIGTTNGGVAFEAERRGASRIVATDLYPPDRFGFDAVRQLLRSEAEFRQLSVYQLHDLSERFDLVFLLGVLYHLRHPLLALDAVYSVARPGATVFIETEVADWKLGPEPAVLFYQDDALAGDPTNWHVPTVTALTGWLETSGFTVLATQSWPDNAASRAAVQARRDDAPPDYVRVSYEVPLRTVS